MNENTCLFCTIIRGDIPSQKLIETDRSVAFLDIRPVNPGHTLVVPKNHSENIYTISKEDLADSMHTVQNIARALKRGLGAEGINIHNNNEQTAGQVIFHTHFHVIPRYRSDGHALWTGQEASETELHAVRDRIIQAL